MSSTSLPRKPDLLRRRFAALTFALALPFTMAVSCEDEPVGDELEEQDDGQQEEDD